MEEGCRKWRSGERLHTSYTGPACELRTSANSESVAFTVLPDSPHPALSTNLPPSCRYFLMITFPTRHTPPDRADTPRSRSSLPAARRCSHSSNYVSAKFPLKMRETSPDVPIPDSPPLPRARPTTLHTATARARALRRAPATGPLSDRDAMMIVRAHVVQT